MSNQRQIPPEAMAALRAGNHRKAVEILAEASGGDLKSAIDVIRRASDMLSGKPVSHSGDHDTPETKGQRENRARTEALMSADTHTPTVMPGDSTSRVVSWMIILILAAVLYWIFGA